MYAEIVFFLPFDRLFTYRVPGDLRASVAFGTRVLAPFGKKTLTGICIGLKTDAEGVDREKIKDIADVPDLRPVISEKDLEFYKWMAEYYVCSLGEVLRYCTPYGSEITSSKKITSDTAFCLQLLADSDRRHKTRIKVLEAITATPTLSFKKLQRLTGRKNIYAAVRELQAEGAITVEEHIPKARVSEKKELYVKPAAEAEVLFARVPELERRSPQQLAIALQLLELGGKPVAAAELLKAAKSNSAALKALAKKGFATLYYKKVRRRTVETFSNDLGAFALTALQQEIFSRVWSAVEAEQFKVFLLHGVTGSGKTLVYLDLAERVMKQGKSVLLLVPEISLTPQITARFYAKFGEQVVVVHSQIAAGERFDTWNAIQQGSATIVIGARSALFAPLQNMGLIIVDEEHDSSFKQHDTPPRYNARDAAIMKAKIVSCPVLLGSATPSVESMHNALEGKYELLLLPERADNATLPDITLVNVVEEKKKKRMQNIFSQTMIEKIGEKLRKKEGVILLQNRRGFSTQVYCFDCGEMEMCQNCSVALVHHINSNLLKCHYCGMEKDVPAQCGSCGSFSIKYFGAGTERVEDELVYYFPSIKMERLDSDSIQKKGSLSHALESFRRGDVDILIGTQMVAKGLDFSRVTLVCVVSAETNLWLPDFRADERTFQLLTQVAGRAGRSAVKGEVLIQTQNDMHPTLRCVVAHDYQGFYRREEFNRKRLFYPPFTRLCLIETKHKDEEKAKGAIIELHAGLKRYKQDIRVTPPSTAVIAKLRGEYRYQTLARSTRAEDPTGRKLRFAVKQTVHEFREKSAFKDVPLSVDIDPQSVM